MQICNEMPVVQACDMATCAYNRDAACHAKAITIGDGVSPGCDTYLHGSQHVQNREMTAGVGACKVAGCQFNRDLECGAASIRVAARQGSVQCSTFQPA